MDSATERVRPASVQSLSSDYAAALAQVQDLEYPALEREVRIAPNKRSPLGFSVASAKYFSLVTRTLKLTSAETRMLTTQGFVSVDHQQRYSMASVYASIYGRDLPVLITTDSILHALHRSFDQLLIECETDWFSLVLRRELEAVHGKLEAAHRQATTEPERLALRDVDVYVSVALNLLAGGAAPPTEGGDAASSIAPRLVPNDAITAVLTRIEALASTRIALNGGERRVDFSQFRPRGHYTKSAELSRYFRAAMWLSRADLGFILAVPPPDARIDLAREQRAAAALELLLEQSQQPEALGAMSGLVDLLVGVSDDFDLHDLRAARRSSPLQTLRDLGEPAKLAAFGRQVSGVRAAGHSQIRSQLLPGDEQTSTPVPVVFQLFGQRFTLDGFLLSHLVYDSIQFRGKRPERLMPSGLDVMAALGNNLALQLQRAEIEEYHYAANLLAARRAVTQLPPTFWRSSVYSMWLDALRTLMGSAEEPRALPRVMQGSAWQKKQLTTQLASWAELRHDTILYAKQSYTAMPGCGYPDAYVEPYPAFFERMELLASELARQLHAVNTASADPQLTSQLRSLPLRQASFFERFASRMAELRRLADKELRSEPFTREESDFLKQTVDRRMVGSGQGVLAYTGWYAGLIYGRDPAAWKPSVADVHTAGDHVLEEGVGDTHFGVVAIDNQKDHAVYVGPIYSHYEFRQPATSRLQDEEFARLIEQHQVPARPAWTSEYQAPPNQRTLDAPTKKEPGRERFPARRAR